MPSVSISPILNAQVVTDAGAPASGWKIYSYVAGSTTPLPVYTDATGTVAQSNPVILNVSGFPTQGQLWLEDAKLYKFVLTDQNDVLQRTFDQISGVNDPSLVSAEQWQDIGTIATFVSLDSFSLAGDLVSEYHIGRRVQLKQGVSFAYGYITVSSYSPLTQLTTVTVALDAGPVLTTALSQSNLSLLRADHHALPKINYELNSLLVGTVSTSTVNATTINATTINMSGADNWAAQVTLASAATVDIGAAASNSILITGTTTINSFGTAAAGILRMVEFQSSLTLTYNATSMQLPGAANITTQPGDVLFAYSKGGGNWKIVNYAAASGAAISSSGISRVQIFTAPGASNFTVPAGVTRIKVTVTGGGAGSIVGGSASSVVLGAAGATAIKWIDGLTPGQVIPLVVGAGGASGFSGSASNFAAFCTAGGGVSGGSGGIAAGGNINLSGGDRNSGGLASFWGVKAFGAGAWAEFGNGELPNIFGPGFNGIVVVEY
jgi:hypothetical protein